MSIKVAKEQVHYRKWHHHPAEYARVKPDALILVVADGLNEVLSSTGADQPKRQSETPPPTYDEALYRYRDSPPPTDLWWSPVKVPPPNIWWNPVRKPRLYMDPCTLYRYTHCAHISDTNPELGVKLVAAKEPWASTVLQMYHLQYR